MKAARQAFAHFASKFVPSNKSPASATLKAAPSPLDTEQLRQVAGGALPKGGW